MPSLEEVAEVVKYLLSKGDGDRKCHFGLIDVEAAERKANPKGRTRFVLETDDAEMYSAFNAEKDRIIAAAGNKSVALSIMHRAWCQLSNEMVRTLAEDEGAAEKETLGDA